MKKILAFALCLMAATVTLSAQNVVKWSFSLADKGNGEVDLVITAQIDKGWHLYDTEIPVGGPNATELTVDEVKGAVAVGKFKATGSQLHKVFDDIYGMEVGYYETKATFVQRFRVTDKDAFVLKGDVRGQACNEENCTPPLPNSFSFNAQSLPAGFKAAAPAPATPDKPATATPAGTPATTSDGKQPAAQQDVPQTPAATDTPVAATPDSVAVASQPAVTPGAQGDDLWRPVIDELNALGAVGSTKDQTLVWIFIFGFLGGLLALLTPCVWPIIPMTVSFFLKRSGSRSKAIRDAFTYGIAIVVIYVTLGLVITAIFGASALNALSTSALFNLIFFGLLVLFAVSFFGAFDLTLPASWTNKMDEKAEATTGLLSIFFMAFTLVLVSFSCTGPIIGGLLAEAGSSGAIIAPAMGMLGFSIALAIPFALFALFPSWLQSMPKSGGWLNSVKVVLGFLELALALKFFSVADLAYGWGILDREVFLVLWIVIFALLGLYLLGKLILPHDSELKHVSVTRLFLAIVSFSFAIYMVPGLWGAPLKAISAFSPPLRTQDFSLYTGEVHAAFTDYDMGMEFARRNNKPVMVDFSGHGCVNCRKMENSVWIDPRVKSILEKDYVLITLMVDDKARLPQPMVVDDAGHTVTLKTVGDKWSYLQRHKFGTSSQPYYVTLDGGGNPVGPSYAFDQDVDKYIKFLKTGLEGFKDRNKQQAE